MTKVNMKKSNSRATKSSYIGAITLMVLGSLVLFLYPNKQTSTSPTTNHNDEKPSQLVVKKTRFVTCSTTKGDFEVELFPDSCPNGYEQFLKMVHLGFFDQGIAFFRANKVCIQFGAYQHNTDQKFEELEAWSAKTEAHPFLNNTADPKEQQALLKQHPWGRGTLAMIGNTQMVITRLSGGHPMGTAPHDCPLGMIRDEKGMSSVLDRLYDGYGNAIDNGGEGPDQRQIFARGMDYIREEFPLLDYIRKCEISKPTRSSSSREQ